MPMAEAISNRTSTIPAVFPNVFGVTDGLVCIVASNTVAVLVHKFPLFFLRRRWSVVHVWPVLIEIPVLTVIHLVFVGGG
jgi:hypothetical protein